MAPTFDPRSVAGYAPIMTEVAQELLARWDALPDQSEAEVAAAMTHTTLHIISRAMFSSDSDDIVDVVERGVGQYQATVRPGLLDLLHFPLWLTRLLSPRRAVGTLNEFDQMVDRLISARSRQPENGPKDLLTRLIAARDSATGGGMNAKEVRDQVVTIFMAGHETTAQALSWTWYLLSQHPSAEAKLHDELAKVLAGRMPSHEDLADLRYTRMVVEESMRLYPPAHTLAREAIAPDEVGGHYVPAHAEVLIVPWLLHRKPSLWERPDCFEPERFSPDQTSARPRFAYIPFGAGPRICIGAAFAMEEAMLVLGTIAQRYRLRLKPQHPVEPQGLITLRPRYGLRMVLERRAI
jgi:cytochrome P450